MKILVVGQHYWPENFRINDLVRGFVERGHEVDVLCGQPNYPKGEFFEGYDSHSIKEEEHEGVKIYRVREIKRGNNSNIRIFLNYMAYPIFSWLKVMKLAKNNYDRIFIYQLSPVFMCWAGLKLGKRKHINTTMYILDIWPQNLYSVLDIKSKLIRNIMFKVCMQNYSKPDKLVTVSDKMRSYFAKELGRQESEIEFIPQCPEKIYETPIKDDELVKKFSGGFNLVFTGNISPAQDLETFVTAAKEVVKSGIEDIRFIIVGDGMSKKDFEEMVKKEELEKYFFFEGFHPIEDMPKYTYIADALFAPLKASGTEDFSIPAKVMSYLASGRPILLSMQGEAQKIINDAKCGFVNEPEDVDALKDNIVKLYNCSKEERIKMGNNASNYQQEFFERDKNVDKLLSIIEKL